MSLKRKIEPQTEVLRLRRKNRELQEQCKKLTEERDEYLRALMDRFKKESQQDNWDDFDPKEFKYTLQDIFSQFEEEEGPCLPESRSRSATPVKSVRKSNKSSAGRKSRQARSHRRSSFGDRRAFAHGSFWPRVLRQMEIALHVGFVRPLKVDFGIDEKLRIVYVRKFAEIQ